MADSYQQTATGITSAFASLGEARAKEVASLVTGDDGKAIVQAVSTIDTTTLAQVANNKVEVLQISGGGNFSLASLPPTLKVLVFTEPVVINGTAYQGTVLLGPGNDSVNFSLVQAAGNSSGTVGATIDPGAGSNTVVGSTGADLVYVGTGAKDTVDGGAGIDTLNIAGKKSAFTIKVENGKIIGDNATTKGHFEVMNAEILKFDDGVVVNVATAKEATLARLYEVVFNRAPDAGGMKDWLAGLRDQKITVIDAAKGFVGSAEATALGLDKMTNGAFLDALYQQAFGRTADAGGKADWLKALDQGALTRADVVVGFAESAEAGVVITGVNTITGSV